MNKLKFGVTTATLLLAGFPVMAMAMTTYTYTGLYFSGFNTSAGYSSTNPFTTSDRVTGYFTVDSPLAASTTTDLSFGSATPASGFSFSNGINTLTNNTSFVKTFSFSVTTDASGDIAQWSINIGVPSVEYVQSFNPANFGLYDRGTIYDANMIDTANGFTSGSGTWTITSSVPEPQPYAMLLAGLGLVGYVASRRNRPVGVTG